MGGRGRLAAASATAIAWGAIGGIGPGPAAAANPVQVFTPVADTFASERQGLERQWSSGDDVSTEDLRLALRRYRAFFDRLLSL